jgi:hypothetical protein
VRPCSVQPPQCARKSPPHGKRCRLHRWSPRRRRPAATTSCSSWSIKSISSTNGRCRCPAQIIWRRPAELGGNHQTRGNGNSAYRQQNHLPLMIVHPAYPGGKTCEAVTSQIDLTPTFSPSAARTPRRWRKPAATSRGAASQACWPRRTRRRPTRCARPRCSITICCRSRTRTGHGRWNSTCATRRRR